MVPLFWSAGPGGGNKQCTGLYVTCVLLFQSCLPKHCPVKYASIQCIAYSVTNHSAILGVAALTPVSYYETVCHVPSDCFGVPTAWKFSVIEAGDVEMCKTDLFWVASNWWRGRWFQMLYQREGTCADYLVRKCDMWERPEVALHFPFPCVCH